MQHTLQRASSAKGKASTRQIEAFKGQRNSCSPFFKRARYFAANKPLKKEETDFRGYLNGNADKCTWNKAKSCGEVDGLIESASDGGGSADRGCVNRCFSSVLPLVFKRVTFQASDSTCDTLNLFRLGWLVDGYFNINQVLFIGLLVTAARSCNSRELSRHHLSCWTSITI